MAAALALAERTRGRTAPNPNVGCIVAKDGRVVGRGWTQAGGRPHAEAMALSAAGAESRGATAYVTLEPCAHQSPRGPACSDLLLEAGVARVVAAIEDPDPRTAGAGFARLRGGGVLVATGLAADAARASMAGFLTRRALGRPFVTLKLATSLDGCIARADGESRWITGPEARAHAHLERSRHEAILVGRGTWAADAPALDVRLPGLEARAPVRVVLSGGGDPSAGLLRAPSPSRAADWDETCPHPSHPAAPGGPLPSPGGRGRESTPLLRRPSAGWGIHEIRGVIAHGMAGAAKGPSLRWGDDGGAGERDGGDAAIARIEGGPGLRRSDRETAGGDVVWISSPAQIAGLAGDHLLVEGGAGAAAAFLRADLVDRLLLYRAPILIGGGLPALGDIGLGSLAEAHGRWRLADARALGSDRLEVYERGPCSPASSPISAR